MVSFVCICMFIYLYTYIHMCTSQNRFMKKNPSGMLPVCEVDGQMVSDSIRIMQVLDGLDDSVPMLPVCLCAQSTRFVCVCVAPVVCVCVCVCVLAHRICLALYQVRIYLYM